MIRLRLSSALRATPLLALPLCACVVAPPPAPPPPGPVVVQAPPPRPVIVRPPPPAPVVEAIPVAPSAVYVWRPGHWRWTGYSWVWVRGRYVLR